MLSPILQAVFSRLCAGAQRFRTLGPRFSGVSVGPGCRIGPQCEVECGPSPARRGRIALGNHTRLATLENYAADPAAARVSDTLAAEAERAAAELAALDASSDAQRAISLRRRRDAH